jgi:hypothetical protein
LALGDHPGAQVAQVVVEISGTAWSSDPLRLPEDTGRALETDGRAELLKVLGQDNPVCWGVSSGAGAARRRGATSFVVVFCVGRRSADRQIWRVSVIVSRAIGLISEGEQQHNRRRDHEQAGGRYEVTNGRSTAIHDTTDRIEERQSTRRTHDHEREQRPPSRPGPVSEKTNPEHTGPTTSDGDANNERRDDNGLEPIP